MPVFLTAEWRKLLNITYAVDPEILKEHVPKGLELDLIDGKAFVSLVAFDFLNTKVKGFKIPFHVNFPEINLRYYLKNGDERGVAFIKEFVPKHCIAYIADKIYNEPYISFPMESKITDNQEEGTFELNHKIWIKDDEFEINVIAKNQLSLPPEDSVEHYFKEHETGYGVDKKGNTLTYKVEHPLWEVYEILDYQLKCNFAVMYGEKWAFLNDAKPYSALLAEGSHIKVYAAKDFLDENSQEEPPQKIGDLPTAKDNSTSPGGEAKSA